MRELDCRIVLTEKCNASCEHCFNADARHGKSMDIDKFLEFANQNIDTLNQRVLKVMGGEPTIHPRFQEFIVKALNIFGQVNIFTNGTTMPQITKNQTINKHPNVGYTINGFTFDASKFESYKDNVNQVALHFVLTMDGADKMVRKALNCADLMKNQAKITYSPDTQVDLFDRDTMNRYRKVWMKAVTILVPELRKRRMDFGPDHALPACFFTPEMIDELAEIDCTHITQGQLICCYCSELGLIDTNFDLYHCNQTRIKLGSLLNDDNSFKTMDEIREMIHVGPRTKISFIEQKSKACKDCPSLPVCRVGCYYNTLMRRT